MLVKNRRGTVKAFAVFFVLAAAIAVVLFGVRTTTTTITTGTVPAATLAPTIVSELPKPPDHFALNLASAYNGFVGENWKRENHDDDGIPADGRVLVPGVVPRAFFQFKPPDEPNAIQLAPGTPITITIPKEQRGNYGRLAVLHGSSKGNAAVHVMLHYDSGDDASDELRVQDWNRIEEAKETFVHKALKAGRVQLFSQIMKLDTKRVLESVTLQTDSSAVIFSLTMIVSADRAFNGATGVTVPSRESMRMDDQKK